MGEELYLKLWPIASRDDGHFDNLEKIVQQRRHFGIESRFTFRECTVKIEDNQLLHSLSIPASLPSLPALQPCESFRGCRPDLCRYFYFQQIHCMGGSKHARFRS